MHLYLYYEWQGKLTNLCSLIILVIDQLNNLDDNGKITRIFEVENSRLELALKIFNILVEVKASKYFIRKRTKWKHRVHYSFLIGTIGCWDINLGLDHLRLIKFNFIIGLYHRKCRIWNKIQQSVTDTSVFKYLNLKKEKSFGHFVVN